MDKTIEKLTVFFENPFWVGIFERISDGKLSVCKVTFGSEPKDYEVLEFILKNYNNLSFSEKTRSNISANKNPGMEFPTKVNNLINLSINLSFLTADNIPRGIDTIKVIIMALPANFIV